MTTNGNHAVQDAVHYAYFAPYTLDDHMALVSELQSDDRVRLHVLGESLDGHDIDMLQIGDGLPLCLRDDTDCAHDEASLSHESWPSVWQQACTTAGVQTQQHIHGGTGCVYGARLSLQRCWRRCSHPCAVRQDYLSAGR